METILITPHVINTIKSLPDSEKSAIATALVKELILDNTEKTLSPFQEMLYSIIRYYIKHDTMKYTQSQEGLSIS